MLTGVILVSAGLLIATWVLYPLVMASMAALRPRPSSGWNGAPPLVTMVVATREGPDAVRERVRDLLSAEYPADRLRVVIGLDVGIDQPSAAYEFPDRRVRFVAADGRGKAAALNAAMSVAEGEIVVFSDTAQRFDPAAVRYLVDALGDPQTSMVSGALQTGPDAGGSGGLVQQYWRMERALRKYEGRVSSTVGVTGAVYGMRRALWSPLPEGLILDDLYVPMRAILAGGRVGFEERAKAFDARGFRPAQEYRRKVRTLTGVLQLCAWLPGVLVPWRNPAWLQFMFHKLLRFATPILLLILVAAAVVASASAAVRSGSGALLATGMLTIVASGLVLAHGGLRRLAWEGLVMQAAVLKALVNAARARWDVW